MFHFILLFIIILSILYWFNPNNIATQFNTSRARYIGILALLCTLSAFKASTVGNDTPEYVRIFEICPDIDFESTRYEIGYIFYNKLLYKISSNPQILFITTSLFIFYSFGLFIWKHSEMPWFSLIIFFLCGNFIFVMSALRQSIALAILLFAIEFLFKKKYIYYVVLIALASTFHSTALLFLISLPLCFVKLNKKTLLIFGVITVGSYLYFANLLETVFSYYTEYERYTDSDYFQGGIRFASVIQLMFSVFFLYLGYSYYKKIIKSTKVSQEKKEAIRIMVLIHLVAVFLYVLCLKVNLIDRFAVYYAVFVVIFVPNAINQLNLFNKKKIVNFLIIFYAMYTIIALIYRPNWNTIYPYKFFWQESVRTDIIESRY